MYVTGGVGGTGLKTAKNYVGTVHLWYKVIDGF